VCSQTAFLGDGVSGCKILYDLHFLALNKRQKFAAGPCHFDAGVNLYEVEADRKHPSKESFT
jgi:hypothetical protein